MLIRLYDCLCLLMFVVMCMRMIVCGYTLFVYDLLLILTLLHGQDLGKCNTIQFHTRQYNVNIPLTPPHPTPPHAEGWWGGMGWGGVGDIGDIALYLQFAHMRLGVTDP